MTLTAAAENNLIYLGPATFTVTLPTLGSGDAGFVIQMIRYSNDANYVHVVPPSGTIVSRAGSTALIRIGQVCELTTFTWSGGGWFCMKSGGMIGEVISFDGPIPPGWLECFGAPGGFGPGSNTFCELYSMVGGAFPNRAGRVDACWDPGYGVIGSIVSAGVVGAVGGAEQIALTTAQLPAHGHHMDFMSQAMDRTSSHSHPTGDGRSFATSTLGSSNNNGGGGGTFGVVQGLVGATGPTDINHLHEIVGDTQNSGSNAAHSSMQPTITTRKLIRAC